MLRTRWRKLRNYMNSDFRKYLGYAAGEIVLVIAGILIALQIDGWNDERQIRRDLNGQLGGVAESIAEDMAAIGRLKHHRTKSVYDSARFLAMLGPPSTADQWYTADLVAFGSAVIAERQTPVYFVAAKGAYESLEVSGNSRHIEDDGLKRNLHNYYATVERIEFAERQMNSILNDVILKYQTETTRGIPRAILQEPLFVWPPDPADDDDFARRFREAYRELLTDPVTQSLISSDRNQPLFKEYERLRSLGTSLITQIHNYLDGTRDAAVVADQANEPRSGPAYVIRGGYPEAHSFALLIAPASANFGEDLEDVVFEGEQLRINYEGGPDWLFLYTQVGPLGFSVRKHHLDFSRFDRIRLDLRRHSGCESLELVVKDADDADDGSQANIKLELSDDWATYEYELARFADADLSMLNVPAGFLMDASACSFSVRDVRFLEPDAV